MSVVSESFGIFARAVTDGTVRRVLLISFHGALLKLLPHNKIRLKSIEFHEIPRFDICGSGAQSRL